MSFNLMRNYISLAVGIGLFALALYEVIAKGMSIADTQVLVTGLLGIYFIIDVALRVPAPPMDGTGPK